MKPLGREQVTGGGNDTLAAPDLMLHCTQNHILNAFFG
ncbi:hypothetical protein SPHINGO391_470246 [Sphingomonas aurantiaca]|jgi:hypothetical protein|uniref:Uncharacterized protein n=1 Tax=Sphingomonas aurantiaca TaxID=185949 RepID=A0A5E7ZSS2_9SPHN|nr:hypothetical protein SPHINGO391_470246 [Sphingomonas aurantiaca]